MQHKHIGIISCIVFSCATGEQIDWSILKFSFKTEAHIRLDQAAMKCKEQLTNMRSNQAVVISNRREAA